MILLAAALLLMVGKALAVGMIFVPAWAACALALPVLGANTLAICALMLLPARGRPWLQAGKAAVALSAALALPLLPDVIATLRTSGLGWGSALFFGLSLGSLWILFMASVRMPLLCLAVSVHARTIGPRLLLRAIVIGLALPCADFVWIFLFPLFHFGAAGAPIPLAPLQQGGPLARVVLMDPQLTSADREDIYLGGAPATERFGRRIGLRFKESSPDVVVLPETLFFAEPALIQAFAQGVALGARDELTPWQGTMVFGAQWESRNAVFTARWNAQENRADWRVVGVKGGDGRVPFFERSVMGLSFREEDDSPGEPANPGSSVVIPAETQQFPLPASLAICYEAMVPSGWKFGKPRVVLTNHSLFSRFFMLSWVYDANLRLLGTLHASPLLLVGNFGQSGLFSWGMDSAFRVLRLEGSGRSL